LNVASVGHALKIVAGTMSRRSSAWGRKPDASRATKKTFLAVIGPLPVLAGFAISRNCQRRSVMMVAMVMVMVLRSAHHAFDAADNAPGDSADNAANRRANRAGCAPAFGRAFLTASNNALRLRGDRQR
jgi:hypothetical protein